MRPAAQDYAGEILGELLGRCRHDSIRVSGLKNRGFGNLGIRGCEMWDRGQAIVLGIGDCFLSRIAYAYHTTISSAQGKSPIMEIMYNNDLRKV